MTQRRAAAAVLLGLFGGLGLAETLAAGEHATAVAPEPIQAVLVPMTGDFRYLRMVERFNRALTAALQREPKIIVFELSSHGGRIDVADAMVRAVMEHKEVRTVAYINGNQGGAYSAAAFFATSCTEIYMAPGQTIGAAVAFHAKETPELLQEKLDSAWRGTFRAIAEANRYPSAVVGAMVSSSDGLAEVEVDGKSDFVAVTSLGEAETTAKAAGKSFGLLRTICPKGRVLTLTSQEAVRVRIAKAEVGDVDQLWQKLAVDPARTVSLDDDPLKAGAAAVEADRARFEKGSQEVLKKSAKAQASDPGASKYLVDQNRVFVDNGREWKRRSRECLASIRGCLSELAEMKKLADALEPEGFKVDLAPINKYMAELRVVQEKVKADMDRKGL